MIAARFRSVVLAAGVATAALSCYMVSLRVASERNELARAERRILDARADIRALSTEIATRGRLGQLEQWNTDVLGLSAPRAAQVIRGEVQLASLTRPVVPADAARVVPVSAPFDAPKAAPAAVVAVSMPAQVRPRRTMPTAAAADMHDEPQRVLPLFQHATFEKTSAPAQPQRVALLDPALLDDLGRLARREAHSGKVRR